MMSPTPTRVTVSFTTRGAGGLAAVLSTIVLSTTWAVRAVEIEMKMNRNKGRMRNRFVERNTKKRRFHKATSEKRKEASWFAQEAHGLCIILSGNQSSTLASVLPASMR